MTLRIAAAMAIPTYRARINTWRRFLVRLATPNRKMLRTAGRRANRLATAPAAIIREFARSRDRMCRARRPIQAAGHKLTTAATTAAPNVADAAIAAYVTNVFV